MVGLYKYNKNKLLTYIIGIVITKEIRIYNFALKCLTEGNIIEWLDLFLVSVGISLNDKQINQNAKFIIWTSAKSSCWWLGYCVWTVMWLLRIIELEHILD